MSVNVSIFAEFVFMLSVFILMASMEARIRSSLVSRSRLDGSEVGLDDLLVDAEVSGVVTTAFEERLEDDGPMAGSKGSFWASREGPGGSEGCSGA